MGILAKDGVVMASERKITSGLLAPARVRCIYCWLFYIVLGVDADCTVIRFYIYYLFVLSSSHIALSISNATFLPTQYHINIM